MLRAVTQEKHLFFLFFDLFCRIFWNFPSFSTPSVVVVDFIGNRNPIKLLSFFFSVTFFIVAINICLYAGLLWFCGVFLFSSFFFLLPFVYPSSFFMILSFNFFKPVMFFLPLFIFLHFLMCFSPCS